MRGRRDWRFAPAAAACVASAALLVAAPAFGQTPPAEEADAGNVTSYKPDFFSQFRPNTAMDMIGRLPGFSFDGGSGARGFEGTGGNVLIDGERPPSRGDSLSSVLSRIPVAAVERIDIINGGAPGIDMQGKAIVANVIRKADVGVTGAISAGANVNSRGDVPYSGTLQAQNQSGGTLIEGAISYNNSPYSGGDRRTRTAPSGAVIREGEAEFESHYESVQATAAYETALLGGKVRINGLANAQTNGFDEVDVLSIPIGTEQSGNTNDQVSGEAGVRYTRNVGKYAVELVGFQSLRSSESSNYFNTSTTTSAGVSGTISGTESTSDSGESIARATVRLPKFGEITVDTGAETSYNFSESESARFQNGAPLPLAGDMFHADELRTQAFATATWAPSEKLSIEAGARYEWSTISAESNAGDSEKRLGFFKPRLNVSWTPETGHQYGLRIERVVEQLSFGAFASSASFEQQVFGVGNPQIEPEKAWIVDARYERRFGGQNVITARYVHREIEDIPGRAVLVRPDPNNPAQTQFLEITRNVGDASRDSLELDGTFELDRFGMEDGLLTLGLDLRDSWAIDPVTGVERMIGGTQTYSWNFSLQQTLYNGAFRWALFVEDDEDTYSYSPRGFSKFSGSPFIGANISWKPTPKWSFGAGVNNWGALGNRGWSVFHDAPRGPFGGRPLYLEAFTDSGVRTVFVNMRRNF